MQKFNTKAMILTALFTALIAIGAFIQIPLPGGDYFTMQLFFVILSGILLGAKNGVIAAALYVIIGLVGFPIFAAGGGFSYVLRPTFGYLLGFILCPLVVGKFLQNKAKPSFKTYLGAAFLGMAVVYAIGFAYKYMILNYTLLDHTSLPVIVTASLAVDVPADAVLCVLTAAIAVPIKKSLKLENRNANQPQSTEK